MFFKYTWNNFLHTQVEICVALILASPFESLENGTILDKDSTRDNILLKHVRLCIVHLTLICIIWDVVISYL